ncbi:MAG: hypothetical protein ACLPLR_20615 [Terriglobales bacterium]
MLPELLKEESLEMAEQKIDLAMLSRIDSDQKATASRVDKIQESVNGIAREVSEIKGVIKPPAEAPAWLRFFIYPLCVITASSMVAAVIMLLVKVNGIETFIHDNGGFIAGLRLQQSATDPFNQRSVADAQQILKSARRDKVIIPVDVVEKTGTKFLDASQSSPKAWDATLAFVDYRSYLNGPNPPLEDFYAFDAPNIYAFKETHYVFGNIPDKPKPQFTTSLKRVPIAVSARLEQIGHPFTGEPNEGPQSLLGVGGELALDGYYLRSVILEGMIVHYNGGPVTLENVTFINCQFVMDNIDNGRALGSQLLASSQVTFKAPIV